jgi:hypothetical protein
MCTELTEPDDGWPRGWDGHERAQRRRIARLTLSEKLEWLEQAYRVARHLQGQWPGTSKRKTDRDNSTPLE